MTHHRKLKTKQHEPNKKLLTAWKHYKTIPFRLLWIGEIALIWRIWKPFVSIVHFRLKIITDSENVKISLDKQDMIYK